jgi:hypothetical protein
MNVLQSLQKIQSQDDSVWGLLVPIGLMLAIFYLLVILPQKRKRARMLASGEALPLPPPDRYIGDFNVTRVYKGLGLICAVAVAALAGIMGLTGNTLKTAGISDSLIMQCAYSATYSPFNQPCPFGAVGPILLYIAIVSGFLGIILELGLKQKS